MTITKARKKFDSLKAQILADGKVDIVEAHVLLDFIDDYAKSGKPQFVNFRHLLLKCASDNVITEDESDMIIKTIDSISKFLKVEQIVEYVFFGSLAALIVLYMTAILL